jgi:molecular chaperone DnaJ
MEGKIKLKIPKETQSGTLFKVAKKGIKSLRGGKHGDLICRVIVETPINLDHEQKKLLEKFQDLLDQAPKKHNPREKSWFAGVKSFFENLKS